MPSKLRKAVTKPTSAVTTQVVTPKDSIKQLDDEYKQKRRALMRGIRQQQRETAQSDLKIAKKQIGILKRKYGWDAAQIARRLGLVK